MARYDHTVGQKRRKMPWGFILVGALILFVIGFAIFNYFAGQRHDRVMKEMDDGSIHTQALLAIINNPEDPVLRRLGRERNELEKDIEKYELHYNETTKEKLEACRRQLVELNRKIVAAASGTR